MDEKNLETESVRKETHLKIFQVILIMRKIIMKISFLENTLTFF